MLKPIIEFDYWGYPIYLVMAIVGFSVAVVVMFTTQREFRCNQLIYGKVTRAYVIAFILGLACSNIANWFLFPEKLSYPLIQRISSAGQSFYYGMISFLVLYALLLMAQGLDYKFWLNATIPSLIIFHAFGRVGCSLAGCCYGKEITLWGKIFDFPARELEAISLFIMFYVFQRKIKEHRLFWYLLTYSALRFALEFGRGDNRGVSIVDWLSPAQMVSVMIWLGLIFFVSWQKLYAKINIQQDQN
jgi:phosphatidylglycerol:prolipoprotein diacylglycerol transferase